jgi:uroporphyrinogen decarboxylase
MNSRERVLYALNHVSPDRAPMDYLANPAIDLALKQYFNLEPDDNDQLRDALNIDIRGVYPSYSGPKYHPDFPERGVKSNFWGVRTKWIEHDTGGYWDYCDFPLAEADIEAVANWPLPTADDFDYSQIKAKCRGYQNYAIVTGDPGTADVINGNGRIRGMEQTLIDLALDDEAGLLLARRRTDLQLEIIRRTFEAASGRIDLFWMGEDLGTQIGQMISLDTYRKHLRPIHQKFIDLAKSFNIPVMIHTCGSSSWVYNDFIEMGVSAVQTLQPEAKNMNPQYLKSKFGDKLAFHGAISTTGALSFGTPDDVRTECYKTLEIMNQNGGYIFAPAHCIQDNSPVENVLAMYACPLTL